MVLWQSDLRVSWQAQWVSLLLHGIVILLLLLAPWPPDYTVVWLILVTLVVLESVRSQRRIRRREGAVALLSKRRLRWRQQEWDITRRPWRIGQSILLSLRDNKGQRERLWLVRDSMEEADWRQLRQALEL
ncbi:toxin CptA [Erwinia toletana]|uniref:Toxin CptA n=1 Tax=Winslowiella toletana TaxID=92490 RepID=A0ABS4P689_9GAMM|nr:protein YgfX [Winslowiella toletana]MBP2168153.1 toxin CptA [Winslowiella toletana]